MNSAELQSLLPLIIPAGAGLLVLLLGAAKVKANWLFRVTILSLVAGMISLGTLDSFILQSITFFFSLDSFSLFFFWLLYGAAFLVVLFAKDSLAAASEGSEVFYSTLLFILTGMCVVAASSHLAAFFLGLEIYTVGLYILIGYRTDRSMSLEAAVKYLILGAISSGFILLGIALIYLEFGTLELDTLAYQLVDPASFANPALWLTGTALLFVGVGFKLSLAPFHMWAPDVYQGAPTSIAAWIATGSKIAVVAFAIRYLSLSAGGPEFVRILEIFIIASLIIGNLLALYQTNLKRLLAYSSIAHMGYALVPLCVGGAVGWSATTLYLVTYMLTVLAAFGLMISHEGDPEEAGSLDSYRGLVSSHPLRAAAMSLAFFSLAGIPLTAGFIGKWSIFQVALAEGRYFLAGAVVVGASIGVFYYLRVIANLYFSSETAKIVASRTRSPALTIGVLLVLIGILVIGVYPGPLLDCIARATGSLNAPMATPLILISQP